LEDNPFGRLISALLKIEGGCRAFENWEIGTNIIYNTSPRRSMRLYNGCIYPEHTTGWWDTVPPPGCIVCSLDESHPDVVREPEYEAETHSGLFNGKLYVYKLQNLATITFRI
jgi:hypothetical protein